MIDHVSLAVSNIAQVTEFYERVFAALGMSRLVTRPAMVGFGKAYPNLRSGMARLSPDSGAHLCLRAKSTAEIDAIHTAAIVAGGVSERAPSLRPHDRVRYYAAFVVDPDGKRIEAVPFPKDEGTFTVT